MSFKTWINTFIDEKGIDRETMMTAEGPSGTNFIPVGCLVDCMIGAPKHERDGIKNAIVRIDFHNGDVMHFFKHVAQAIAQ